MFPLPMSAMSFKFPYQYGYVDGHKIPYPVISLQLQTIRGNRDYFFIFDSGADLCTLPHYMIKLLGLEKSKLKKNKSQGVGKKLVNTLEGEIQINFCNKKFPILCSFTLHDKTPLLLGKQGIFDRFNIKFDNDQKNTVFTLKKR